MCIVLLTKFKQKNTCVERHPTYYNYVCIFVHIMYLKKKTF